MKFEDMLRMQVAKAAELRYTVRIEFDGMVFSVERVPEETAKAWLWERVRGGVLSQSVCRVREVTATLEDGAGHALEYAMRLQGITK